MYSIFMINTYNESSLHKELKNRYCKENKGKTEQEIESYICDIVCENGSLIEIQTKNLGNLNGKILQLLQNYVVTLVYPLAITTYIEYYDENNIDKKPISRKKSPASNNLYDMFDELMGCFPILLHKNFKLKVIEVRVTKERIRTKSKTQSLNKKRRYLKDWLSHDTTLDEIIKTHTFSKKSDYIRLLPSELPLLFTVNDIVEKSSKKITKAQAYKLVWTFNKMGIIEFVGKEGRSKVYRLIPNA